MSAPRFFLSCSSSFLGRWPLDEARIGLLEKYGVKCLELTVRSGFTDLSDPEQMRFWKRAVSAHGLRIPSSHIYTEHNWDLSSLDEDQRQDAVKETLEKAELAAVLGSSCIVIHPSVSPPAEDQRRERIRRFRMTLRTLDDFAAARGLRFACETMCRQLVPDGVSEMEEILRGFDVERIGVCVDTNHLNLSGDLPSAITRLKGRIYGFHLSDNDGQEEKHWFPLEGVIDWPGTMASIAVTGYHGPLNFEFGCPDDLEEDIKKRIWVFDKLISLV